MNKIQQFQLYSNSIVSDKWTRIIISMLVMQGVTFFYWFQPPSGIILINIIVSLSMFSYWIYVFVRSTSFATSISQNYLKVQQDNFYSRLAGCHPNFVSPAKDCWSIVIHIIREFDSRQIQHDIEASLTKVMKLTTKHSQFYARARQFGDEQQKHLMEEKIHKQIHNIELARQGLLRLGGYLTILDYGKDEAERIERDLKTVNQGLEDAIGEIDDVQDY